MSEAQIKGKKQTLKRNLIFFGVSLLLTAVLATVLFSLHASAAGITIDLNTGEDAAGSFGTLELLFLLVILALAPSLLLMMTSFTRIIIVLSFLRNALGTQQSPPNQVLIGLALFLSIFIMMPTLTKINEQAITPFSEGTIEQDEFVEKAVGPLKEFMLKQINPQDLNLFLNISGGSQGITQITNQSNEELMTLGLEVIVPAFITSELKRAFFIGFLLFLPFLVIDMVVSSILMSMGMVMLPPSMIALPFKIMIFVVVGGWDLLIGSLVSGFTQ